MFSGSRHSVTHPGGSKTSAQRCAATANTERAWAKVVRPRKAPAQGCRAEPTELALRVPPLREVHLTEARATTRRSFRRRSRSIAADSSLVVLAGGRLSRRRLLGPTRRLQKSSNFHRRPISRSRQHLARSIQSVDRISWPRRDASPPRRQRTPQGSVILVRSPELGCFSELGELH